ncbi:hypothetical protein A4244_02000 [Bacillus badius]|nr:hypothetical protein A4244_02000 [Bacillus badius]OCS88075.1 hypothetical protein A6M11_02000 [Bacillus badius]OVE53400.1 hypothetical protein B1A98_00925 [Bacillus badius]
MFNDTYSFKMNRSENVSSLPFADKKGIGMKSFRTPFWFLNSFQATREKDKPLQIHDFGHFRTFS